MNNYSKSLKIVIFSLSLIFNIFVFYNISNFTESDLYRYTNSIDQILYEPIFQIPYLISKDATILFAIFFSLSLTLQILYFKILFKDNYSIIQFSLFFVGLSTLLSCVLLRATYFILLYIDNKNNDKFRILYPVFSVLAHYGSLPIIFFLKLSENFYKLNIRNILIVATILGMVSFSIITNYEQASNLYYAEGTFSENYIVANISFLISKFVSYLEASDAFYKFGAYVSIILTLIILLFIKNMNGFFTLFLIFNILISPLEVFSERYILYYLTFICIAKFNNNNKLNFIVEASISILLAIRIYYNYLQFGFLF